jgi:hypothetical protein
MSEGNREMFQVCIAGKERQRGTGKEPEYFDPIISFELRASAPDRRHQTSLLLLALRCSSGVHTRETSANKGGKPRYIDSVYIVTTV